MEFHNKKTGFHPQKPVLQIDSRHILHFCPSQRFHDFPCLCLRQSRQLEPLLAGPVTGDIQMTNAVHLLCGCLHQVRADNASVVHRNGEKLPCPACIYSSEWLNKWFSLRFLPQYPHRVPAPVLRCSGRGGSCPCRTSFRRC